MGAELLLSTRMIFKLINTNQLMGILNSVFYLIWLLWWVSMLIMGCQMLIMGW